jgi:hypothetical protein
MIGYLAGCMQATIYEISSPTIKWREVCYDVTAVHTISDKNL